jgi:hypothetical protein
MTNDDVRVYGVFDKGWHEASVWSAHQRLLDAGANVRMDGNDHFYPDNPYHGSKIHDKIMIIDAGYEGATVFTGSFNFSPSAAIQGNDENCIFIRNKAISIRYRTEIEKLYRYGLHPTRGLGGDTASFYDVVIDEVNWAGSRPDAGTRLYNDKFVALRNRTDSDINISGWQLWGTVSTTYRMLGHIFPKGTVIPAKGYHILGYSSLTSGFKWDENWSSFEYLGTMHSAGSQNFINLRLKDVEQNYIDLAGQPGVAPFAGEQGGTFASMKRIALDGTIKASWSTSTQYNDSLKEQYMSNTRATPGTDGGFSGANF